MVVLQLLVCVVCVFVCVSVRVRVMIYEMRCASHLRPHGPRAVRWGIRSKLIHAFARSMPRESTEGVFVRVKRCK